MKVYYAHPESMFKTDRESDDLGLMGRFGFNVVDPAWDNIHGVVKQMKVDGQSQGNINSFLHRWMDKCDGFVFRGLPGGAIPEDVAVAIARAKDTGKPILQLPDFPDS